MKFPSLNSVSPLEIVLLIIFILYLIYPIPTPELIAPYVNSNLGMAFIIILTFYMVFYTTPILGVLTIVVAYELLRRSANITQSKQKIPLLRHTPTQPKKDKVMAEMNGPKEVSLEEEIVQEKAPVGKGSILAEYTETNFKPVQEKILGASMV
jgi:hypothetical protein